MCLYSTTTEPLRSEKKIPVYKILTLDNEAPFYSGFQYGRGMNVADKRKHLIDKCFLNGELKTGVYGGFLHAYVSEPAAIAGIGYLQACVLTSHRHYKIVKMYVPENTNYYLDESGNEICAEKLYWKPDIFHRENASKINNF